MPAHLARAEPVTVAEFSSIMARLPLGLGPRPWVAVALSGGADSMALCWLAWQWLLSQGGKLTCLTVDHGLSEATSKAIAELSAQMASLNIFHVILPWLGDKPNSGIQAAARCERYRLLASYCADRGILHLLLGHQLEDQAETVLLRLGKGSDIRGAAAMAWVRELAKVQLIRPLLGLSKQRLKVTCCKAGWKWFEDPANLDSRFARTRLRELTQGLASAGVTSSGLARSANRAGHMRTLLENQLAQLLAQSVAIFPQGYLKLQTQVLRRIPDKLALRAMDACLRCVRGGHLPAKLVKLERICRAVVDGLDRTRTLGGCLIIPTGEQLLICREPHAADERLDAAMGSTVFWDGRFRVRLTGKGQHRAGTGCKVQVARLGRVVSRAELQRLMRPMTQQPVAPLAVRNESVKDDKIGGDASLPARVRSLGAGIPAAVQPSLPALWDEQTLLAVPHLGYYRNGLEAQVAFTPAHQLAGSGFVTYPGDFLPRRLSRQGEDSILRYRNDIYNADML